MTIRLARISGRACARVRWMPLAPALRAGRGVAEAHACAAKAGINQLVRVLALEWGPDVRVNGISPGPIEGTEGMARLAPDASTKQKHFDRIAMKRWGFVDEIAEGAVFLSSDAAKYITGAILDIDGGSGTSDILNIDDSRAAASNDKSGTLTGNTLRGLELDVGIDYAGLESLNIWLGYGDNVFTIDGNPDGTVNIGGVKDGTTHLV